ncbi:cysteine synthase family protein [Sphingobium sp. TomTYG45]
MFYSNIAECVGRTPVVKINNSLVPEGKSLFVKLEYFNPTLSIKDRTALGLIETALHDGRLKRGGTIIESTSGNLGRALAMLGPVFDLNVIIVVDPKAPKSLLNLCRAFGAKIEVVEETDENGGYQKTRLERVRQICEGRPDAFWPNQYDSDDNPQYHAKTTAREIENLNIDALVGSVSTGGHLCGIARHLQDVRPSMSLMACDVTGSAIFGGSFHPYLLNGVGLSWRSANMDESLFDHVCVISDQLAISLCHILAREEGLLLGGSSGLALFGALALLHKTDVTSALVIAPDSGHVYLDQIYDENWLRDRNIEVLDQGRIRDELAASSLKLGGRRSNQSLTADTILV